MHRLAVPLPLAILLLTPALAAADPSQSPGGACALSATADGPRGIALEANVLWPFFPGGIFELRTMIPVVRPSHRDFRGELIVGAYSDFASRVVRDQTYGKVATLSAKLGYRQFFVHGLHVELSANMGWRHETERPPDDLTIDSFAVRLWALAGWQLELSRALYANVRGGLGIHVYRSDAYAHLERQLVPGADLNLGVRF